jgi:hypothetical protein
VAVNRFRQTGLLFVKNFSHNFNDVIVLLIRIIRRFEAVNDWMSGSFNFEYIAIVEEFCKQLLINSSRTQYDLQIFRQKLLLVQRLETARDDVHIETPFMDFVEKNTIYKVKLELWITFQSILP